MRKHHSSTRKHTPYFEGWYLKYQTRDGNALALIPAIHTDKEGRRSVSLQVITANETWWLPYPLQECALSKAHFPISMGETRFDVQQVQLHVEKKGLSLHGALNHGPFAPLRSDIMGPFRFFSGMECSHGVISMGHALTGVLELNGTVLDFSGGLGYAETDRGRSFPRTYLWTQCTWQEPQLSSLMLSIAHIPWGWGHFTGCICAILYKGREYRLATYLGAKVEQWSADGALIRQGKHRLIVEMLGGQGHPLRAPVNGVMGRTVHESLCTRVRCRFWIGETLLFDHFDRCAGYEYAD